MNLDKYTVYDDIVDGICRRYYTYSDTLEYLIDQLKDYDDHRWMQTELSHRSDLIIKFFHRPNTIQKVFIPDYADEDRIGEWFELNMPNRCHLDRVEILKSRFGLYIPIWVASLTNDEDAFKATLRWL